MKLLLRFFFLAFLLPIISVAQNDDTKVWKMVDRMPKFPGGDAEMVNFLSRNIRYPINEAVNDIQGKVFTSFIVDSTGQIYDVKILRGIPKGDNLSKEAIRVLNSMPKWIPGEQDGKKVAVEMMIPITFAVHTDPPYVAYEPPYIQDGLEAIESKIKALIVDTSSLDSAYFQVCMKANKKGNVSDVYFSFDSFNPATLNKDSVLKVFSSIKLKPATVNRIPTDTNICFDVFFIKDSIALIDYSLMKKEFYRSVKELTYSHALNCVKRKDYSKAIKFYHYSYNIANSDLPEMDLCFNLGSAYFNIGDTASACESWLVAAQNGDKEAALLILKNNPKLAAQKGITATNQYVSNDTIVFFGLVEILPQFPGGEQAFLTYIAKNFVYPRDEREYGIQGKVFVEFIIRPDGSLTDVKVLRGVTGGPGLDKEAVRVISASPKWTPGKQNGKVVSVYYRYPIACTLK